MNKNEIASLAEVLSENVKQQNEILEQNIERKMGINNDVHKKQHDLLAKYDEIFNEDTLDSLRDILKYEIARHEQKQKFRDYFNKTAVGVITVSFFSFFFAVGKIVIMNLDKVVK